MTTKIRILVDFVDIDLATGDFVHESGSDRSVDPGTVVDADLAEDGTAWYAHPESGEAWASPRGLYEIIEKEDVNK